VLRNANRYRSPTGRCTGPLQRELLVDFHGTRASFFVRQSRVLWIGLFAYGAHILEEFEPNWLDRVRSVRGLNSDWN
jgi:hypothetical protein